MRYHELENKSPSARHSAPDISSAERFRIALAVAREREVINLFDDQKKAFKSLYKSS